MMEKYITDERTGLKYELVGDYYLVVGDDEPEEDQPIGVWGQRHLRYLKEHRRVRYANLLTTGKLNDYLADLNEQAEAMFSQLVKLLAEKERISFVHAVIVEAVDAVAAAVVGGSAVGRNEEELPGSVGQHLKRAILALRRVEIEVGER